MLKHSTTSCINDNDDDNSSDEVIQLPLNVITHTEGLIKGLIEGWELTIVILVTFEI